MGYLITNGKNGRMSFSGTKYVNPTEGKRRICLRTGTGVNDIVRYGLTTNSSASQYCGIKMKISGSIAYIGRSQPKVEQVTNSHSSSSQSTTNSYKSVIGQKSTTFSIGSLTGRYSDSGQLVLVSSGTGSSTFSSILSGETKKYTNSWSYESSTRLNFSSGYTRASAARTAYTLRFESKSCSTRITSFFQTNTLFIADASDAGDTEYNFNI